MADPILVKTAEEFQEDIQAQVAVDTGISDHNFGAAIKSLAFAVGRELEHVGYQIFKAELNGYLKRATGAALDNIGLDWGLTRRTATQAVGTVRLSHSASATVPQGTRYAAPATLARDRIVFETTTAGSVTGSGATDFAVRAIETGEDGNLSSSSITEIVTTIAGVTAVTNPSATTGGQDREDDDSFRARIQVYIEGLSRGTPVSIVDGCLNFEVASCTLANAMTAGQTYIELNDLELVPISNAGGKLAILDSAGNLAEIVSYGAGALDPPRITPITRGVSPGPAATTHSADVTVEEYVPAGKGRTVQSAVLVEGLGHIDVYIDDGKTNGTDSELVSLVQKRLRGDLTSPTPRDPGYRPAGSTLDCFAASRTTVNVTCTIQGTANTSDVKAAVESYLNTRKIGETVYGFEVAAVISDYPGVDNIVSGTLVIAGNTFNGTSSADVSVASTGIVYAGTVNIS